MRIMKTLSGFAIIFCAFFARVSEGETPPEPKALVEAWVKNEEQICDWLESGVGTLVLRHQLQTSDKKFPRFFTTEMGWGRSKKQTYFLGEFHYSDRVETTCLFKNPKYLASVSKESDDWVLSFNSVQDPVVLSKSEEYENRIGGREFSSIFRVEGILSPYFIESRNANPWSLFELASAETADDGATVTCNLVVKQPVLEKFQRTAQKVEADRITIVFAKNRSWLPCEIVRWDDEPKGGCRAYVKHIYEGNRTINGICFPEKTTSRDWFKGKEHLRLELEVHESPTLSASEISKQCYMSHYGLPEPPGSGVKVPIWVWFVGFAVLLIVVGTVIKRKI